MTYRVKKLQLFQDLTFSAASENEDETLTRYTAGVGVKDMDPRLQDYLTEPVFCGGAVPPKEDDALLSDKSGASDSAETVRLPAGTYAFIQGVYENETALFKAAETLWLECIWQEFRIQDSTVYMRKLKENDIVIFQLFRRIGESA